MFRLSRTSLRRLDFVHPDLITLVTEGIAVTKMDFGVAEGLRSLEEQKEYVEEGLSQTLNSKHRRQLDGFAHAVDLYCWKHGSASWELEDYFMVVDALVEVARKYNIAIRWGGAWHIDNLTEFEGTAKEAHEDYLEYKAEMGEEPFIDGPHIELVEV